MKASRKRADSPATVADTDTIAAVAIDALSIAAAQNDRS